MAMVSCICESSELSEIVASLLRIICSFAPSRKYFRDISASTIWGVRTSSASWIDLNVDCPFSVRRKISIHRRNQQVSSPRSSSLNGFIFPRSAPNACLINSLRCCLTSRSTCLPRLLVFKLRCREDSFLAVSLETLTVVDCMKAEKVFQDIRIPRRAFRTF